MGARVKGPLHASMAFGEALPVSNRAREIGVVGHEDLITSRRVVMPVYVKLADLAIFTRLSRQIFSHA